MRIRVLAFMKGFGTRLDSLPKNSELMNFQSIIFESPKGVILNLVHCRPSFWIPLNHVLDEFCKETLGTSATMSCA